MGAMPISHVCLGCGDDLAHLRPGPDPHYGLRVVVCPACGAASVRTREPLIAGWRYARRLTSAALLCLAHGVLVGFLAAMCFAFSIRIFLLRDQSTAELRGSLAFVIASSVFAGLWMGVSMPHRGPLVRAAVWAAALLLIEALVAAVALTSAPWRPNDSAGPLDELPTYGALAALILGSAMLVLAAEVIAVPCRFLLNFAASALFRWRRRRAQLRRSGL